MAQITLDSTALDELNSAETRTLFDTADKLSSLGVGRIVNLPQIIVVGDQSSGKSSVLEAISHVHFPVQGGVCTRFATELVLRPGSRRCVTASVQFADNTRPAHSLQVTDFNQDDIDKIISDAKEKMGLSDTGRSFSKDVLRLEIEGPDMYPLTLVDLPGIFHTATAKQSAEGKATVMELVESYMKKPNSIILAIISANNQLANQVVMQEAAKHDPTKTRTLGVITKPDLLHPGSSNEHEYLQVVRGREAVHNLGLGWHVVRNRADYEKDLGPRDTVEEQFFKSGAWGSIPGTNRGVAALRAKLSHILHDHIKKSLPTVIEDIQDKLFERGNELDRLGSPRTTPEDMRAYLIDIAGNFQRLVHDGIRGHYNDPFFGGFNGTHRKLRSKLRNFNRAIRHVLLVYGSAQEVTDRHYGTQRQLAPPDYLSELVETYADDVAHPEIITWAQLSAELETQAAANQGTEFPGYANMNIVIQLFQKQAEPWQHIAELHLEKVTDVVKAFVDEAFEHIVGPPSSSSTTAAIFSTSVDDFFEEKEQVLSAKLKELLRPFKEGYALPLDADFHEAMEKAAAERVTAQIEGGSDLEQQVEISTLSQRSNDFGTERIVDTMQTFYDMALRTFTDNLINLAIESCLVQDLPSLFTPRLVNSMDDAKLAELAAESEEVRNYRSQLQKDIKLLKQGLEQCRRYRPRAAASSSSSARAGPKTPQKNPSIHVDSKTADSSPLPKTPGKSSAKKAAKDSKRQPTSPRHSRTVPVITDSGPVAQNVASAPSNAPSGTGLFGSSAFGSGFSKPAAGSTAPSVTGSVLSSATPITSNGTGQPVSSPSLFGQPSRALATSPATSSPVPKNNTVQSGGGFGSSAAAPSSTTSTTKPLSGGIFGSSPGSGAVASPAFGGEATESKGLFGGSSSSSAATSSSSTGSTKALFGGNASSPFSSAPFGSHTTASLTISKEKNTPSGGLFGHPAATSSSSSDVSTTGAFGATSKPSSSGSLGFSFGPAKPAQSRGGGTDWSKLKRDVKMVPTSIKAEWKPYQFVEWGKATTDFSNHICTSKVFKDFSPEEIKLADYCALHSV